MPSSTASSTATSAITNITATTDSTATDTPTNALRAERPREIHGIPPAIHRELYTETRTGTRLLPADPAADSALETSGTSLRPWDVVRFRYNGRIHPGTVIRAEGERVWLRIGQTTLAVPAADVVALTQLSPAR